MTLDDLGPRICVMGPSNSGKSTLAVAIGRARGLAPIHLDQLQFFPGTDWEPRPAEVFVALHDAVLMGDRWVMDGNYTGCLPRRLARATGVILLDVPMTTSLARYLRRSWFERGRHGALDGGRDSVKWEMLRYIAIGARANRRRQRAMLADIALPILMLSSSRAINGFYASEGLGRERAGKPDVIPPPPGAA